MPAQPSIVTTPALGITQPVTPGRAITDHRTPKRGLLYICPEENDPNDDAHRINHSLQRIDTDLHRIRLASLIGLEPYLLLRRRTT